MPGITALVLQQDTLVSPKDTHRRASRPGDITVTGQDRGSHGGCFRHGGQERPCGTSQGCFLLYLSVLFLGLETSGTEIFYYTLSGFH